MKNTNILQTNNNLWGFYGNASGLFGTEKAEQMWKEAFLLIKEIGRFTPEQTRDFLDSRYGRHLVDCFYKDFEQGNFTETFKKWNTYDIIRKDYNWYC